MQARPAGCWLWRRFTTVPHAPRRPRSAGVRCRIIDLCQWLWDEFHLSVAKQTLGRELRAMGYRKLSARPRHHAQAEGAVEDFKKRMARPVGKQVPRSACRSVHQRIRPVGVAPAKMEIRASWSS